jgi:hypothetical protein
MIYVSATYADADGMYVIGTDADGITETVPHDYTVFRCPDDGPIGFVNNGGVIADYVEPEPTPIAPHLNNGGLVRFTGVAPSTVLEAIRMVSVTRVAKGRYRAAHETPMPSDQYSAAPSVFDANPRLARITARTEAYVEIRVTDLSGVAQDAAEIMLKTERVIYP